MRLTRPKDLIKVTFSMEETKKINDSILEAMMTRKKKKVGFMATI